MEKLIDISGYVAKEEDLTKTPASEGEFYNVLFPAPFMTYRKTSESEIGDLQETTDIIGWFENKAELDSNVRKPNNNDVYITGVSELYTRWKAVVSDNGINWIEDGESNIKVLKKYASARSLRNAYLELDLDSENFYSVGKTAPYALYGTKSTWECVGAILSHVGNDFDKYYREGFRIGEIAFGRGLFWIYKENGWEELKIIEPFENYKKHLYKDKENDRLYSIREGWKLGTLEFYTPKE